MADKILKKEDKLHYKVNLLKYITGSLVLTNQDLYFVDKKSEKVFSIPVSEIQSVNLEKGGSGYEYLYILYSEDGKDKKASIHHYSARTGLGLGYYGRLAPMYFTSWEQMINDVRFKKIS
jgi:hypothetical protein